MQESNPYCVGKGLLHTLQPAPRREDQSDPSTLPPAGALRVNLQGERVRKMGGTMNNARRAKLEAIRTQLETISNELEEILSDEHDAFDNMPEGLQSSEKGEKAENAIGEIENAISTLADVVGNLEEAGA